MRRTYTTGRRRIRIFTRRLVLTTFLATGMFALTAFGTGPQTRAQTPVGEDSVTGSATFPVTFPCGPPPDIPCAIKTIIDARSGPSGENPSGQVVHELIPGGPSSSDPVTCLNVDGNRATVAAHLSFFGGAYVFGVEDNGAGGQDRLVAEQVPVAPTQCPAPAPPGTGLLVVDGDFIVHDASPFPATPEQCKKGGWQNYPGFKNQGQCVAFVERGPRPREPNGAG